MKRIILLLTAVLIVGLGFSQAQTNETWSLEKCIQYAQDNNLSIKQSTLNADYAKNQYQQKKIGLLPNLNASSNYTVNMGKVSDDKTFQVYDVTTKNTQFGLSSSTSLFNGFTGRNTIKQYHVDWEAAVKEVEKARNDLSLTIAAYYLQILLNKELLEVARSQSEVVNLQVERTKSLVEAGSMPEGSLLEIRSLASSEALNVTRSENNLSLSLLDLAQVLELDSVAGFDVDTPVIGDVTEFDLVDANQAYSYSVTSMPQITASELQLNSKELNLEIAKGYRWPELTFNAGWGTYVTKLKGVSGFDFSQSFKDNASSYYGVGLSIPIFNGFSTRTNIKNAQIGILNAQYELDKQKKILRKEIQQASADAYAALRQYQAGRSAVDSYIESFRYTEKRFSVGMVNSVEYNVAKSDLIKAQSDFIQSKYAYILRTKILDFYMGKPIVL